MRITTAHRYYNGPANVGNNGIVIEVGNYLIDAYFTGKFRLSTAYVPADQYSGACYIAWLGWLHIEVTEQTTLEA